MRLLFAWAVILFCSAVMPTSAFAQAGRFENYEVLREKLDSLVYSRDIASALSLFGTYDPEEAKKIEEQVRSLYPRDFENAALISRDELNNGWRQEVISFWTETSYLYVYLLMHQRSDALVSIKFQFHSDVLQLDKAF